jgi:serine/threonine protein phosphatase PrpC
MEPRVDREHNPKAVSVREYAYLENKNFPVRQTMEDAHFALDNFAGDGAGIFAVLDGHGGSAVVEHCAKTLPNLFKRDLAKNKGNIPAYFKQVFKKMDDQLRMVGASECGCTCCMLYVAASTCYVANLGDTRAVVEEGGKARRVSTDHKVTNPA